MGQVQLQLPLQHHHHHLRGLSLLSFTSFIFAALFADTSCLTVAGTLYCSPSSSLWSSSHWHKNCCPHTQLSNTTYTSNLKGALHHLPDQVQNPDQSTKVSLCPLPESLTSLFFPWIPPCCSAILVCSLSNIYWAPPACTEAISEGVTVRGETHIKSIVLHLHFWNPKSSKIGRCFPNSSRAQACLELTSSYL